MPSTCTMDGQESQTMALSTKNIPVRERLIFALDVQRAEDAKALVEMLGDSILFYKVGLELFMSGSYFDLVDWLHGRNKKVLVDLKFFDIPRTVHYAVRQLSRHRVEFATVHGNDEIMKAAVAARNGVKILAVTVLTSLDEADIRALGFETDVKTLVLSRAQRALAVGCDGVISSGIEARELRQHLGEQFVIVVPGIRPVRNREEDDQKRTVDVEDAFIAGADYIVVGRPIRDAQDPKAAAEEIQRRIAALFEDREATSQPLGPITDSP